MRRANKATFKELVKELESIGFKQVNSGKHRKWKHPVTQEFITLPHGSNPNCDGIFAMRVNKLVRAYEKKAKQHSGSIERGGEIGG